MAAAQQNTTNRREAVEFPPNVPVTLALKYSEPRMVNGMNGQRAMFSTCDDRVLFLDPAVAGEITELGINVRTPFTITRKSSGKRGETDTWEVSRIAGEQGDGTLAVPKLPDAQPPAKPMQRAATAAGGALVEEANGIVDAFAQVLERALTTYPGRVKPEEVKSIFLTVLINFAQKSRAA